jgi:hypothetical protein
MECALGWRACPFALQAAGGLSIKNTPKNTDAQNLIFVLLRKLKHHEQQAIAVKGTR